MHEMKLVKELRDSWGWVGLDPVAIVDENDFGNLIIQDNDGSYWRLCPEKPSCKMVTQNRNELEVLFQDQKFMHDWFKKNLLEQARLRLGPLTEGRKYCLKIPGVLGGEYDGSNLATISFLELIRFSGHVAQQINALPDGAEVEFKITD